MTAPRYNLRMDQRILDSKAKMRKGLASLSFTEKIKIMEKLRDRELAIAAAGLRRSRCPKDFDLDRQAAVVFELRRFKPYYDFTERTLKGLQEKWTADPEFKWPRLIEEIDLTRDFIQKNK